MAEDGAMPQDSIRFPSSDWTADERHQLVVDLVDRMESKLRRREMPTPKVIFEGYTMIRFIAQGHRGFLEANRQVIQRFVQSL